MAKMIAMKRMTYGTRRLKAGDEFTASNSHARILDAIGKVTYDTRDLVADVQAGRATINEARKKAGLSALDHDGDGRPGGSKAGAGEDMQKLRADYQEVVGKRPFPGWDAAELQRRMKEASAAE